MSTDFYRAFEDRYRGSREMIKERLHAYLPFVAPLAGDAQDTPALDLGCGRGEWLELLGEHAFAARGVDLDDGMLQACRERGLNVETADAIGALHALADDSLAVVSAFHLVEHLPFEAVQELVTQSLRVLRPGGILIMETPNPENPMVGACRFYLDPSHVKPIPPNLLAFVTEHAGFARHKVVRLQEDPALLAAQSVRLMNVFDGASPDYGVVAQKAAASDVLARFDEPFARAFGLELDELAQRFEQGQQAALDALSARLSEHGAALSEAASRFHQHAEETVAALAETRVGLSGTDARLTESEARLVRYEALLAESNLRITEVQAQLRAFADEAQVRQLKSEDEFAALQQQLHAMLTSTSWRVTAPLRWLRSLFLPKR